MALPIGGTQHLLLFTVIPHSWAVWSNDWWKFDQVVEDINGQLNCIHDNRERFLPIKSVFERRDPGDEHREI